ncbi:MAG: FAD-dependent oxidoreductase [Candidatus Kapabacteria bacterium]|jgi:glycine/D-amino acid oxidase-like deaminating enzyme|nr:FAD-dependent oxidoreductase [Candidatus Kapabacteria bacterium]
MTRRELLRHAISTGALLSTASASEVAAHPLSSSPLLQKSAHSNAGNPTSAIVVGAGVFGLWTALTLLRRGMKVTLVDAFGVGNVRASSADETRALRAGYGATAVYVEMVAKSLVQWKKLEERTKRELFVQSGCLWLMGEDDKFFRQSIPAFKNLKMPFDELTPDELSKKFSLAVLDNVRRGFFEPEAGYLLARRCCESLLEVFLAEGGEYRQSGVKTTTIRAGEMESVQLAEGTVLRASLYVFACGAWLGEMFPEVLEEIMRPTRQEVFYFGVNFEDKRVSKFPVWVDMTGRETMYGIQGSGKETLSSGFKVANDTRGAVFNPSTGDRMPSEEGLSAVRRFVRMRFPALSNAPLIQARVCQYENSLDGDFIIDRLPDANNALIVGGGSGHGFKHAPAIGELAANILLDGKQTAREFRLGRFARK